MYKQLLLVSISLPFLAALLFGIPFGQQRNSADQERAYTILHDGIESRDSQVRLQTIIATSMIGKSPIVFERLERALTDKDVEVRIAAANTLGDFKAIEAAPALRQVLHDDPVPEVAFAAAKALFTLRDPAGREALTEVFDRRITGQSNILRKQARDFFGKFHSLKSSLTTVFMEGIGFVPVPGAGAGVSAVAELLTDPELTPRASAVLMLGREKDAETTDVLRRALYDKDWSVRAAGAQAIARSARTELQTALVPLFDDSKDKVRFRAAGAYIHLELKKQQSVLKPVKPKQ